MEYSEDQIKAEEVKVRRQADANAFQHKLIDAESDSSRTSYANELYTVMPVTPSPESHQVQCEVTVHCSEGMTRAETRSRNEKY